MFLKRASAKAYRVSSSPRIGFRCYSLVFEDGTNGYNNAEAEDKLSSVPGIQVTDATNYLF